MARRREIMNKKEFWGRREPAGRPQTRGDWRRRRRRRPSKKERGGRRVCALAVKRLLITSRTEQEREEKNGGKKIPGGLDPTLAASTGKNANSPAAPDPLPFLPVSGQKRKRKRKKKEGEKEGSRMGLCNQVDISFLDGSLLLKPIKVVQPSLAFRGRKMINFTPGPTTTTTATNRQLPHHQESEEKPFQSQSTLPLTTKKTGRCTC